LVDSDSARWLVEEPDLSVEDLSVVHSYLSTSEKSYLGGVADKDVHFLRAGNCVGTACYVLGLNSESRIFRYIHFIFGQGILAVSMEREHDSIEGLIVQISGSVARSAAGDIGTGPRPARTGAGVAILGDLLADRVEATRVRTWAVRGADAMIGCGVRQNFAFRACTQSRQITHWASLDVVSVV
jgi:hypothetical protein